MASRKLGMFGAEPNEFIDERNEDGVAALLRRRREELGRDVGTVARQLRIRAVYISAIEDGRLQDLPGTAYAVGFVRAYADYLGLDGTSVVGDYRDELARRSRQNQLIWPVDQVDHRHFPGGIVLAVCVLLAGVVYGGWYFASRPGGVGIDLIDQVPDFMKKQTNGESDGQVEGQTGAEVPADAIAGSPTSAQAAPLSGVTPSSDETNQLAAASAAQPAAPVPTETPAQIAATPATKGVVLRAIKDSWVEIFNVKNDIVLQRILRAGETFTVPVQVGLTMNTGNAGGVIIEVDGKARPALGSLGVVKRGVKLDRASLGLQ